MIDGDHVALIQVLLAWSSMKGTNTVVCSFRGTDSVRNLCTDMQVQASFQRTQHTGGWRTMRWACMLLHGTGMHACSY